MEVPVIDGFKATDLSKSIVSCFVNTDLNLEIVKQYTKDLKKSLEYSPDGKSVIDITKIAVGAYTERLRWMCAIFSDTGGQIGVLFDVPGHPLRFDMVNNRKFTISNSATDEKNLVIVANAQIRLYGKDGRRWKEDDDYTLKYTGFRDDGIDMKGVIEVELVRVDLSFEGARCFCN